METLKSGKLAGFGASIFSVMSHLSDKHQAINLSQGYPDFEGPQALRDRVSHHLNHGHNQYAPMPGVTELREQIAIKSNTIYGCSPDPETQITVTPGATEAIYCALTAVVSNGDEVVVMDPAYDTYVPGILLNGGVPVRVPMTSPDFRIDWQRVEECINARTRVLMINSPHNPGGTCLNDEDINALRRLMSQYDFLVISDEVYEHIVFDGKEHLSLMRFADIFERAFVVSSFGKTYHVTGWRIGYCVAPEPLMNEFRRIHQFTNFSTNTPLSHALADFMRDCPEFHLELGRFYQAKRDLFCDLLKDSKFRLRPVEGTYFQMADYSEISDENDVDFARTLTIEHGVAVIPVSVFCQHPSDDRVIRFCFAKEDETLVRAATLLNRL
ncbi:MAG TPA: methionine aminotransferase [Xanthomonadales bacterium]|nr:methionine aminotransferase [Xanthomonadales bacterium]